MAGRVSLGALGLTLALLVAAAWGTAVLYLLGRLGAGSPVRLAVADGIHVYVGLASAAFFVTKVWRVGFRRRVPGVGRLLLWQRWISWSLLVLYAAIFATGVAALLPLPARWLGYLVNAHLLVSVWAAAPTSWHVWHYRHRALPYLRRRRPPRSARRYWAAAGLLVLPLAFVLVAPRLVSPLALSGTGSALRPAGLGGVYLDRVLPTGDGRLLAGGDGLYLTRGDGSWRRVDLPSGGDPETERRIELGIRPDASPAPEPAGPGSHAGHSAPAVAGTVLSLATSRARSVFYVGTSAGLFSSPWAEGPYLPLPAPAPQVRDLAIDPANPYEVWAASEGGIYLSVDAGHSWARLSAGLARPASAWTLAFFAGDLYASDTAAVYRWDGSRTAWTVSSAQPWVTSLEAGHGHLFAASPVSGATALDGRRWQPVDFGGDRHSHAGVPAAHLFEVAPALGHDYALGAPGSLAGVRDAAALGGALWTVGEAGASRMAVDPAPPAGPAWWALLILVSIAAPYLGLRMIRRGTGRVAEEDRFASPTEQEDLNASIQSPGGRRRGRLRNPGLQQSRRQPG